MISLRKMNTHSVVGLILFLGFIQYTSAGTGDCYSVSTCAGTCDPSWCVKGLNGFCSGNGHFCWCLPGTHGDKCWKHTKHCTNCPEGQPCNLEGHCEKCVPEDCSGHGTCWSTSFGVNCKCDHGWRLPFCNVTIDEPSKPANGRCLIGWCDNYNGKCTANRNICRCNDGYYGDTCQHFSPLCLSTNIEGNRACNLDDIPRDCYPEDCSGHGVCESTSIGTRCRCESNWKYPRCDRPNGREPEPLGVCNSTWCTAKVGVCNINGKYCRCNDGHYGRACEHFDPACTSFAIGANKACNIDSSIVDCDPEDCSGHGTCFSTSIGPRCRCDAGYKYPRCDKLIIPCSDTWCTEPYGKCSANKQHCWCKTGYYGNRCQHYSDHCKNYPDCMTCNDDGVHEHCYPRECSDHGKCRSSSVGPKCQCDPLWRYPDCFRPKGYSII